MRKITYLLLALGVILVMPYIGAYVGFEGEFPAHYFEYPPVKAFPKAGFSWLYFIAIAAAGVFIILFYIYPWIFGFRRPTLPPLKEIERKPFPVWFWVGLILWAGTLFFLWGKFSQPKWLIYWADIPLFWGITITLDGIVYRRTGGKSIMGTRPQEILGIGVASMGGWMFFEYLNFFVENNWIYPEGVLISKPEFLLYAILGSSGLFPMTFEMYSLINTYPRFKYRFIDGPKVKASTGVLIFLILLGFAGLFATGYLPNVLFFLLWLAPITILSALLIKLDIWTPFRPIREGNWSPLLVFATTYLLVGLILECQNYFSGIHADGGILVQSYNPSYWVYSIPYVNVYHLFEMPILGYLGYLPFSIHCWIFWIFFAYLLDIPSRFREHPE